MSNLHRDPIINAIHNGLKADIDFNLQNGRHRATLILIYAAIDTMAFLNMPPSQVDVLGRDFVEWTEKYLKFQGRTQLQGVDVYGARCGVLHTYSEQSKKSREGKCRMLMYVADMPGDPVRDAGHPDYLLVSVAGLKTALFAAIDRFLVDAFASPQKAQIVESRLKKLLLTHAETPGSDPRLRPFLES